MAAETAGKCLQWPGRLEGLRKTQKKVVKHTIGGGIARPGGAQAPKYLACGN